MRTCVICGQQQAVYAKRLRCGAAAAQLVPGDAAHVDQEHP